MIGYRTKIVKRFTLLSCLGMALGTILPSYGQHDVYIKTNLLDQSAQGAPIAGVVVSKDQGDVAQVTDANGNATLTDVNGTMSIRAMHPDYKEFTQTFTINSDTTLYFALPKNIRIGPWGIDTLNVTWYKNTFRNTLNSNTDAPGWKQVGPINNRLAPGQYSEADSFLVVEAINTLENGIGYDLINLVPSSISPDTTYTIELNSFTNSSGISININGKIYKGISRITATNERKRIIHEITRQFDMKPYFTSAVPSRGSVMDPAIQTMTDAMKWDLDHIALTLDQSYRKKNGKQQLFLSQMSEYIGLDNVGLISITSPVNNAVDLDTLLNILGTKDANAIWYDFKITTDAAGNNVFMAQNGVDRSRINVDLEPGKTYFLFERARNGTSTGAWPTPVQITTKEKIITSTNDISDSKSIDFFPNPVNDHLYIKFKTELPQGIRIDIFNMVGKKEYSKIYKSIIGQEEIMLNLMTIKSGLHLIRISYHNSGLLLTTKKIIKK